MSLPLAFRRASQAEFGDAVEWYDNRRRGLGVDFASAVQRILDHITAHPDLYPEVFEDARAALIPGHPYCVYYREEPGQVLVLSVFHTSRDPSIWQQRL
jgi:toxin ParE1/3/4